MTTPIIQPAIPKFTNEALLRQALTHRSAVNEGLGDEHNERLEYLGDAVLELVVSEYVYRRYADRSEGELTSARTALVRTETLSELASKLGLPEHILVSRGELHAGGLQNASLLADTMEAVIGALYIDQGLEPTREFLNQTLLKNADAIIQKSTALDAKSKFQEVVQAKGHPSPVYRIINKEGPDHHRIFTAQVFVSGKAMGKGVGKSKQEAEQAAAKASLQMV